MLSWSAVLQRIKDDLGFPFQHLEKTDEEIVDYCKRNCLKTYNVYFPQKWRTTIDTVEDSDTIRVPNRTSEFYLIDQDDREIFDIVDFIPTIGESLMTGHPFMGVFSYESLPDWHMRVQQANTLKLWSIFNYVTEFIPPNQFRVSPKFEGRATVEYERSNDPELSTIPPDRHIVFTDLCIGSVKMLLGNIRRKFQTIATPFGEIPLNAETMYNDGKELYDKTMELMKNGSLPNIIFDHG